MRATPVISHNEYERVLTCLVRDLDSHNSRFSSRQQTGSEPKPVRNRTAATLAFIITSFVGPLGRANIIEAEHRQSV